MCKTCLETENDNNTIILCSIQFNVYKQRFIWMYGHVVWFGLVEEVLKLCKFGLKKGIYERHASDQKRLKSELNFLFKGLAYK